MKNILILNENEELFYFILNITKSLKSNPKTGKYWENLKKNPDISDKLFNMPDFITRNESLSNFIQFYICLRQKQFNKAILYLENQINNNKIDEFYVLMFLYGVGANLELEAYADVDDYYISSLLKTVINIKKSNFKEGYRLLGKVDTINRLYYFKELLYLHTSIELELYQEVENIFNELFLLNKDNNILKLLLAYYKTRNHDYYTAQKILESLPYRENGFDKAMDLLLFVLIETKQFDKAIQILKNSIRNEKDIFTLGKLYHAIGLLNDAMDCYNSVDEYNFEVNKQKGLLYFQLGEISVALEHFKKESEIRFNDIEIQKMIKYLELKQRWKSGIFT